MKRLAAAAIGLTASLGGTPYLDRHVDDAVRFRPFGEAAFAEARAENLLVFVSVGFFACNGCHLMESESFENPELGALLNERVVPVLVDRDDRPDLDARFARDLETFGVEVGWPMTLWLLPDGRAISAATYLTPQELRARTERLSDLWAREPARLLAIASASAGAPEVVTTPSTSTLDSLKRLVRAALDAFDPVHGGLLGAPKFPRDVPIETLLVAERAGMAGAATPALLTLEAVLRSSLHDVVDGGFHRYAVDAAWLTPHWEKTLDDNALLALDLLAAWRVTGREEFRRGARTTLAFLSRRLALPEGGFGQALDSESTYYQLPAAERARARLPARDDSRIVSANAHAARAFARAAFWFGDEADLASARETVDSLLAQRKPEMPHALRRGAASGTGTLADHAGLGLAALELFLSSGEVRYLEAARELDLEVGRRFVTADGALLEFLGNPWEVLPDRPAPSGAALAVELATRLSWFDAVLDRQRSERARRAFARLAPEVERDPLAHADGLLAGFTLERPIEIVLAARTRAETRPWLEIAARHAPLGALVLVLDDGRRAAIEASTPLAAGKTTQRGQPRAFVCKGWVCDRPAGDLETFRAQLEALP